MTHTATARRESAHSVRARILAIINDRHQVRESDICDEFQLCRATVVAHLKALGAENLVHRVIPMNVVFHRQLLGQVWALGPQTEPGNDRATAEPIQVSTRVWKAPAFKVSMLERLMFPSYGVAA